MPAVERLMSVARLISHRLLIVLPLGWIPLRRLYTTFLVVICLADFSRNAEKGTVFDRVSEERHRVVRDVFLGGVVTVVA